MPKLLLFARCIRLIKIFMLIISRFFFRRYCLNCFIPPGSHSSAKEARAAKGTCNEEWEMNVQGSEGMSLLKCVEDFVHEKGSFNVIRSPK